MNSPAGDDVIVSFAIWSPGQPVHNGRVCQKRGINFIRRTINLARLRAVIRKVKVLRRGNFPCSRCAQQGYGSAPSGSPGKALAATRGFSCSRYQVCCSVPLTLFSDCWICRNSAVSFSSLSLRGSNTMQPSITLTVTGFPVSNPASRSHLPERVRLGVLVSRPLGR